MLAIRSIQFNITYIHYVAQYATGRTDRHATEVFYLFYHKSAFDIYKKLFCVVVV